METLILLAIVVAAVIIIKSLSAKLSELHFRFDALNHELRKLKEDLEDWRKTAAPQAPTAWETKFKGPAEGSAPEPAGKTVAPEPPKPFVAPELLLPLEPVYLPEPPETEKPIAAFTPAEPLAPAQHAESKSAETEPEELYEPIMTSPETQQEQGGFWDNFVRNNPDLEKFIGENLINKIGIAILVLGIGYFVKFAIDKDWINEIGRVFIGILAGGLLIGVAHRLRNSFSAFSSVLVGGGIAVLYFTIAIAFHEYRLLGQTPAFLVMAVITGFSVLLSVTYNRVELAVLALLG
ncbi:MAG TPA: DUF2339 domain-containing protein, partial [Adhaeribacter sp.]|nr:DUF2339 domain-containing protein [Adhaeribacter sp.]